MIGDDYRARVLDNESVPKADYAKVVEEREHYPSYICKRSSNAGSSNCESLDMKSERPWPNGAQLTMAVLATQSAEQYRLPRSHRRQMRTCFRQRPQ